MPKPECGASRTSQASTRASCSASGRSTQSTGCERCDSSASTSSRPQEVELRYAPVGSEGDIQYWYGEEAAKRI